MNVLSIFSNLIKPVFDGIFKWKSESNKMELSRQEFELMKTDLESEIQLKMAAEMRKPESKFREFMLKYEGSASEQTPFMRNLRSSVRPVITYWALIIISLIMFGAVSGIELKANLDAIPEQLWQIFLAIFGFWFGGRAVMQVAEAWKKGDTEKEEAKLKHERVKYKRVKYKSMKAQLKSKPDVEFNEAEFWGDGQ